jgi:hypothetical protein
MVARCWLTRAVKAAHSGDAALVPPKTFSPIMSSSGASDYSTATSDYQDGSTQTPCQTPKHLAGAVQQARRAC